MRVGHGDRVRVAADGGAGQRVHVHRLQNVAGARADEREGVVVGVGDHQRAVGGQVLGGRLEADVDLLDGRALGEVDLGHGAGGSGAGNLAGDDVRTVGVVGEVMRGGPAAALVGHESVLADQHDLARRVAGLDGPGQRVGLGVDDTEFVDAVQRDVELRSVRAEGHAAGQVGCRRVAGGQVDGSRLQADRRGQLGRPGAADAELQQVSSLRQPHRLAVGRPQRPVGGYRAVADGLVRADAGADLLDGSCPSSG